MALGDSILFGVGVDDEKTFAHLVERQLQEKGVEFEFINAGVYGYDLKEEINYYEKEGRLFDVDVILLAMFHNDIRWTGSASFYAKRIGLYQNKASGSRFCYVCEIIYGLIEQKKHRARTKNYFAGIEALWAQPARRNLFSHALRELHKRLRDENKELIIILFPSAHQLDDAAVYPLTYQTHVKKLTKQMDIAHIDLYTVFKNEDYRRFYLPGDPAHLSEEGHAFVADVLSAAFAQFAGGASEE